MPAAPTEDLKRRLDGLSEESTRQWWETYLKGEARFRGVKTPAIRSAVHEWYRAHDLSVCGAETQMDLAFSLMREEYTEDKLAGMLLLQEILIPARIVVPDEALPRLAKLFDQGVIADWNVCDWLCVRVLGPLIEQNGPGCARRIADWSSAENLWRRRAAGVAFVNLAGREPEVFVGLRHLVFEICVATVAYPERFSQTGTGWVLRELSKVEPDRVAVFVQEHLARMSREGVRYATAKLDPDTRNRLLTMHKGT